MQLTEKITTAEVGRLLRRAEEFEKIASAIEWTENDGEAYLRKMIASDQAGIAKQRYVEARIKYAEQEMPHD